MEIDPFPPISEMTDPITETEGVARDIADAPTAPGGGGCRTDRGGCHRPAVGVCECQMGHFGQHHIHMCETRLPN